MKGLKKIEGAKTLSKKEQKELKGGYVAASCADLGVQYWDYETCIEFAPINCRDWCNR